MSPVVGASCSATLRPVVLEAKRRPETVISTVAAASSRTAAVVNCSYCCRRKNPSRYRRRLLVYAEESPFKKSLTSALQSSLPGACLCLQPGPWLAFALCPHLPLCLSALAHTPGQPTCLCLQPGPWLALSLCPNLGLCLSA